jgi:imidazole glycerol phosphate synthase glutamine amidotransferase subunit
VSAGAELVIVDTGAANLASVRAAFRRLGVEATVSSSPEDVRRADRVVLPGVGAFGDAMRKLEADGVAESLRERVRAGRPLLAICLGLQLLAAESDEAPGVSGLGLLDQRVERFGANTRVPQLGWNRVVSDRTSPLLRDGHAYFANSYRLAQANADWTVAWSDYGGAFIAAIERGPQLGCQFHPELSGAWGAQLLERWYASC